MSYADVGALLFAGLMVLGLQTFLNRTITGQAMQAVAQNTFSAEALGIKREADDLPRLPSMPCWCASPHY